MRAWPFSIVAALVWVLAAAATPSPAGAATVVPPDGYLVWSSNRELGRHEIYVMKADGGTPRRITSTGGQFPAWSPDGRWISYHHTADSTTHVVRWDGSDDRQVCGGFPVFWMHDGSGVVCAVLKADWPGWEGMSRSDQYLLAHPDLGTTTELFKRNDFAHLQDGATDRGPLGLKHFMPGGITHDGRWLVGWVHGLFEQGYTADNGRFQSEQASVVLDLLDRSRLYYLGPGCTTTTPPAGDLVYHVSREGPSHPDIFSLNVNDLTTRASYKPVVGRTDPAWGHDYFPRVSNDGRYLVYGASLGCHAWFDCDYEIFLHQLGSPADDSIRLTTHAGNDNYPALFVGEPWRAEPEVARIALAPDRLSLIGSSAAPPGPRRITVWSAGGKPLGPVEVRVLPAGSAGAPPPAWLAVRTLEGGPGAGLELEVRPQGLPSGMHTAEVEVRAAGAINSPHTFPVRLTFVSDLADPPDAGVDARTAAGPDTTAAGAAEAGATPAPESRSGGGGCACDLAGPERTASLPLSLLLVAALALMRVNGRRR